MEILVDYDVKIIVKASFSLIFPGLNVVFRKLASHSKPSMEILVDDEAVKIIVKASFFTQTMVLPLNQAYEEEFDGIKMNVSYTCLTRPLKKKTENVFSRPIIA